MGEGESDPADLKRHELLSLKLNAINAEAMRTGDYKELLLTQIRPDPHQPRKTFLNLEGLAESIKLHGVIQPIIVTRESQNGCHQIIAGERRFHAAKQAGLHSIPCILREGSEVNILLLQLLENDQREDVSPVEEATAIAHLVSDLGIPKQEIAKELGRDSAWVSMRLGLYAAPQIVKDLVNEQLIEDWRTLHELRMLADEAPELMGDVVDRIRKNQLSGSYRVTIGEIRKKHQAQKTGKPSVRTREKRIQKMEKAGEMLLLHIGGAHPMTFRLPKEVLVQFLTTVSFDG